MSLEHSTKLGVKSLLGVHCQKYYILEQAFGLAVGASLALKSLAQLDKEKIGLNYALVMLLSEQN